VGIKLRFLAALALLVLAGCESCAEEPVRPGRGSRDASAADQGTSERADSGTSADLDAALVFGDAKTDAGSWPDATAWLDASVWLDASARDAAPAWDATALDAWVAPDAAPLPDAWVAPDATIGGNGEVWIEIDYSSAQSPRSPSWRFSQTPGWGPSQWAAVNATQPEAWDRWNNMSVVNDPIGRSLEIGSSSELQLMIGLEELVGYDSATVRIEGRSRSTSASAQFDVYNPWNGCGTSATISNSWDVHVVELDLGQCFEVGQGVQAVRVEPTNGTLALVRLRLTLHGAVY
jgi:hypothetical protein